MAAKYPRNDPRLINSLHEPRKRRETRIRFATCLFSAPHYIGSMPRAERGVPLSHYRKHGANVEMHCGGCALCKVVPLDSVIARLNARGIDGESVGIVELADYVTAACERCGRKDWTTRPAFPSRPGQDGITRA